MFHTNLIGVMFHVGPSVHFSFPGNYKNAKKWFLICKRDVTLLSVFLVPLPLCDMQAVQLESVSTVRVRYLMVVSTLSNKQESILLGVDFPNSDRSVKPRWRQFHRRHEIRFPLRRESTALVVSASVRVFSLLQWHVHHRFGSARLEWHTGLSGWRWVRFQRRTDGAARCLNNNCSQHSLVQNCETQSFSFFHVVT